MWFWSALNQTRESRPKIVEVVSQLERVAADWDGVMPPRARVEDVVLVSPDPVLDCIAHGKLWVLIFPIEQQDRPNLS